MHSWEKQRHSAWLKTLSRPHPGRFVAVWHYPAGAKSDAFSTAMWCCPIRNLTARTVTNNNTIIALITVLSSWHISLRELRADKVLLANRCNSTLSYCHHVYYNKTTEARITRFYWTYNLGEKFDHEIRRVSYRVGGQIRVRGVVKIRDTRRNISETVRDKNSQLITSSMS